MGASTNVTTAFFGTASTSDTLLVEPVPSHPAAFRA
jgi:hypothetical protein